MESEKPDQRKRRCHNCVHASESFKVLKLTHHHCYKPEHQRRWEMEDPDISPWDTLRVFSDTCNDHEFKTKKSEKIQE